MPNRSIAATLILGVALLVPPAAWPQGSTGAGELTLEECLALALERSPQLQRSREGRNAALARVNTARAFQQPTFSYDSDLQPRPFHFGRSGESYLGLSQTIEFPGKRATRGRIALAEADEAGEDLQLARLELRLAVRVAFHGLQLAGERLKLAGEDLALAKQFASQTRDKHAAGDVGRVEVLRAEVEEARAEAAVTAASSEVALAAGRLNGLMARPAGTPLAPRGALAPASIPADVAGLKALAAENRPELRRARLVVERENLRRAQARLSYFPDVEVGFARHRVAGEVTSWDVTLAVPLPLYFWQPRKGEIAEARANAAAAEREAEHLRNQVEVEIEAAHREALTAAAQIARFEREILPKAQESYEMFAFAYREGEIEGLELIAARRSLLEARQAYVESLYGSSIAAAALTRALGEPASGS